MVDGDDREVRQRCRNRLEADIPAMVTLQGRARQRVATVTHGLSERVEALGQHIVSVRMKADRMQRARGAELADLLAEFETAWSDMSRCAAGIRAALEGGRHDEARHDAEGA